MTLLCKFAQKYGTDKYPGYTPNYYNLLKDKRESFKKVLELGIGIPRRMEHVPNYKVGASLYMWREFFPNAQIYGLDVSSEAMIKDEERIKTFLCDERKKDHLLSVIQKIGTDIDLFVDDGLHMHVYQLQTFQTLMPLFKKEVIYIIEDASQLVKRPDLFAGYHHQIIIKDTARAVILTNI